MTQELYLIIICLLVIAGSIIIGELYSRIGDLKTEVYKAKGEAKALANKLDKERENKRFVENWLVETLNHKELLLKHLDELRSEINALHKQVEAKKGWKARFESVTKQNEALRERQKRLIGEHRRAMQRLYGRIGSMQRQLNRHERTKEEWFNLIQFLSIERYEKKEIGKNGLNLEFSILYTKRYEQFTTLTKSELEALIKENGLKGLVDIDLLKPD